LVTELIEEAVGSGCRRAAACATLDITLRTYQRWTREDGVGKVDGRKGSRRTAPANKLCEDERQQILAVANSPEFASSPPSEIVPTLVDRGEYLASESTIYRILKAEQQQHHRGRAKKPSTRVVTSHCATEANRLWAWDITWLPASVTGLYFYWYFLLVHGARRLQPQDRRT
jgi:putative transposase